MANLIENTSDYIIDSCQISLNWKENPAAKEMLDVLVTIISNEYIQTAKQNPDIFLKKGDIYESSNLC